MITPLFSRVLISLITALLSVFLIMQGDFQFSLLEILKELNPYFETELHFVIMELRFPPIAGGLLGGALFGSAGAIFQKCLRNELATPDIIGVSSAASLGTVVALTSFSSAIWAGFVGSAIFGVAALIIVLSVSGALDTFRWKLIISGLAVGYLTTGLTNAILSNSSVNSAKQIYTKLVGSTSFASYDDVVFAATLFPVFVLLIFVIRKPLLTLEIGDEQSSALGYSALKWTGISLFIAVLFTTIGVGLVGPISFISLLPSIIARTLLKSTKIIDSALLGALLVLLADAVNVFFFPNLAIPTGITTGLVGAPVLLYGVFANKRLRGSK